MDGHLTPQERVDAPPKESVYAHGCALFRKFVLFLLVICLVLVGLWWVARYQSGYFIRQLLLQKLEEHYGPKGIAPRLGDVKFVEGQGIWLRDLAFHESTDTGEPIVEIDEILIRSDARLWQIVTEGFQAERVFIRRFHAHVTPDDQGQYALARLMPLPQLGDRRLPVMIEDAAAHLSFPLDEWQITEHLSDLRVEMIPKRIVSKAGDQVGWHYQIRGNVAGTHLGQLQFGGWFRDNDQRWSLGGKSDGLHLTTQLIHASSTLAGQDLSDVARVDAFLDFSFSVSGQGFSDVPATYQVQGQVNDGRLDDLRLPYPVVDIQGEFSLTPEQWNLQGVSARSGQGMLNLEGSRTRLANGKEHYDFGLNVRNVMLDSRLSSYMPPMVRNVWRDFEPAGLINAKISVSGTPAQWHPQVHLHLVDVGMRFHQFRYPVQHCTGMVDWTPERVTFDVEGRASGSRLSITGEFDDPGPCFTGRCDIKLLEPIPISEDLYEAFASNRDLSKLLRSFEPSGNISVTAVFQRQHAEEPVHRSITIDAFDGSIRYDKMPYPLTAISGKIVVEDDWVFLRELVGRNDAGYVTCNGSFSPENILALEFLATSVPLEEELRKSLPLDLGSVWSQLRPQGNLDHLQIKLTHDFSTQQLKLRCEGQMWKRDELDRNSVSVSPTWLPYTWNRVTGSFIYEDGVITLKDIRGQHRQTEISLEGTGQANREGWWLDLRPFAIDRLSTSDELLGALPQPMAESLRAIDLQGSINLLGRVILTSGFVDTGLQRPLQRTEPIPPGFRPGLEVQWDLDCDIQRGSFDIATERIHDVHGSVHLLGVMQDEQVYCWGQLEVDTLMLWEAQGTKLSGPLYLDNQRLALGTMAPTLDPKAAPYSVNGQLLQGKLSLDAELQLKDNLPFTVQLMLKEARLESFADEIAPQMANLSGQAKVGLRVTGTADGTHTIDGQGNIRLTNARIYEFPLLLNMLKVVSVSQVDRTAFNTSNIDFQLKADRILLDRVELIGDAISLKGVGEVDLNRRIQAQFHSTVGRSELKIPIISPLFGAASRQILLISVEGTLDDPKVTQVPFPLINDALRTLLSEPEPAEPQIISGIPAVGTLFDEAVGPALR